MDHQQNPFDVVFGCDYAEREIDPNLTAVIDDLGVAFGPLGVAFAAAVRTEPEAIMNLIREAFSHQRDLWGWLTCERYYAEPDGGSGTNSARYWLVKDSEREHAAVASVTEVTHADAEDAARALARHLNSKIILAKMQQAQLDNSAPHRRTE